MPDDGFHEGELLAQRHAQVRDDAQRLATMLTEPTISAAMGRFIAQRTLVFITSVDAVGRLWTSPLSGPPGFCNGHDQTLTIAARPAAGDPLQHVEGPRSVGALFVDFDRRRRLRVNGVLRPTKCCGLEMTVEQAFGNCPRYISSTWSDRWADTADLTVGRGTSLEPEDSAQITHASTFVLGTRHPDRGADTSHRGGEAGFVQFSGSDLSWPDYPGNNLFNSIGNLLVEPAASLLFVDPEPLRVLQISGRAEIEWAGAVHDRFDDGTERIVRFAPEVVVRSTGSR